MNQKYLFLYSFLLIILFAAACQNQDKKYEKSNISDNKTLSLYNAQFAELFKISEHKNGIFIQTYNKDKKLIDSILISKSNHIPTNIKAVKQNPKIICMSTAHLAFLDYIGMTDNILAVSNSDYVYNPKLRKKIEAGTIRDIGYQGAVNWELLISLTPDLVTVYSVDAAGAETIKQLKKFGIPYLLINEFSEQDILGQTEWAMVFASLYGKEKETGKKLNETFKKYQDLKQKTKHLKTKPTVMLNMPWKGTWYIPAGKSNAAKLIADAGGTYIFGDNTLRHNRPVSIENVIVKAKEADFWLNPGQAKSIDDILLIDSRLDIFKPIKTGQIYNRIKRISSKGGNDYMESGTVQPEVILKDLIHILHPELIENSGGMYYYVKLN